LNTSFKWNQDELGNEKRLMKVTKFEKQFKLVMAIIHEDDGATNDLCQQSPQYFIKKWIWH
jgi:hypothetical protein